MKYTKEFNIYNFPFWCGAEQIIKILKDAKLNLDILNYLIEEIFCETIPTETEINDFVWFEDEIIAEAYGFNSFDEIIEIADKKKENKK